MTLTTSLLLSELRHSLLHSGVGLMVGSVAVSGCDICRCCAIVPWRGLALETQLPLSVPCPAAADSVTWIMLCTVCNSATRHPPPVSATSVSWGPWAGGNQQQAVRLFGRDSPERDSRAGYLQPTAERCSELHGDIKYANATPDSASVKL